MEFQQPIFYQFNEDSIRLAHWIANHDSTPKRILEIGAGCGIISIEYLKKIDKKVETVTLIELQSDFIKCLELNLKNHLPLQKTSIKHIPLDYNQEDFFYDLIISNPPYFKEGSGRVAQDEKRQLCRTFSGEDIFSWVEKSLSYLSDNGVMYFLATTANEDLDKLLMNDNISMEESFGEVIILKALKKETC